jgi:hypothetical protein
METPLLKLKEVSASENHRGDERIKMEIKSPDPRDVAAKERDDAKFKAITSAIGEIL